MATLVLENIPESVNQALLSSYPNKSEREEKILSLLIKLTETERQKKIEGLLDNLNRYSTKEQTTEKVLREIRDDKWRKNLNDFTK